MSRENKSLYSILGILTIEPKSGYEIKKLIESSLGHFWYESYGQIYPNLKKLLADELITMENEKQEGKPDKKIYAITKKGEETLKDWLLKPAHLQVGRNELLLKLFFGHNVPTVANKEHIIAHQKEIEKLLEQYTHIEDVLTETKTTNPNLQYWLLTISYGRHWAEATIKWCRESIEKLNSIND
ncbi:PadR family transcriptional regulator [Metabacillus arenae]|uniref:PadR family transcriptional regulator n=1 Tax=Metabacillus arenae TaxID=2771434 RepID=A0A926NEU0_9BACI|nr:PadR family transcriptional regulator [Metabacillus arenae]MBD1382927.1 PadR family transcriptional regulator [Metabacillus arenae]